MSKAKGLSAHAFMLQKLEEATAREEAHQRLIADALAAEKKMLESGVGYRGEDVHAWMEGLIRGENPPRPKPVRWRK